MTLSFSSEGRVYEPVTTKDHILRVLNLLFPFMAKKWGKIRITGFFTVTFFYLVYRDFNCDISQLIRPVGSRRFMYFSLCSASAVRPEHAFWITYVVTFGVFRLCLETPACMARRPRLIFLLVVVLSGLCRSHPKQKDSSDDAHWARRVMPSG